jgi:hypothetical protein
VSVYRLTGLGPAAAGALTLAEVTAWARQVSGDGPGPQTATLDELRGNG